MASVSSCAGHLTMETVYGQTLALWLGNGDEHCALESDTTGLNVKGNLLSVVKLKNDGCIYETIFKLCFQSVVSSKPSNHHFLV